MKSDFKTDYSKLNTLVICNEVTGFNNGHQSSLTSPSWAHFGFEPDENGQSSSLDEAICEIHPKNASILRYAAAAVTAHLPLEHPKPGQNW